MPGYITLSEDQTFALSNRYFSYVFRVTEEGLLEHLYYGSALERPLQIKPHHDRVQRGAVSLFEGIEDLNLNELPQEYPTFGRSDYRAPAFHGTNVDGNSIFSLHYKNHKIVQRKPKLGALPSAKGGQSETLIITLEDSLYGLEVDLLYTIYEDFGVLARSVTFNNSGAHSIKLKHVHSSALDIPAGAYEILHLHGTWSNELIEERIAMPSGKFGIESARGTSSAAHQPFIALMDRNTGEDHGEVYGATLLYSGNFSISAEKGEFGDMRLLAGINPFNFDWTLNPGERFHTPEALHVYSDVGLRGMSHIWHDFIRDKISPDRFRLEPRPTYLNTWEAAYFDIDEAKVLDLADQAKGIGVDMLVLDDGWFEGRNDDTTSLSDWTADKTRFPSGIPALAAKVKAKGLKFGIWVEPEMVSPNSQLYRAHPEWALHVPGRKASLGRNQLTLDLSRDEVVDHIFQQMDAVLSSGNIDYVKWDMNRNMTETGSSAVPAEQQGEVSHRYMLGLYQLLQRLTDKYPNILFENCASGGNRFDLGMLRFMAQGWVSDMCDPIGRLSIINGASYLYPLDVMAAYIGPSPNHQNGRESSLQTRFLAGIFCSARGVSLGESAIIENLADLQKHMHFAKETATDMVGGCFDRLIKNDNEVCWQYSSRNKQTVYIVYFHILSAPNLPNRSVRLTGLDAAAYYVLQGEENYQGDTLMNHGISLPSVTMGERKDEARYMDSGDFSSHLLILKKVP